MFSFASVSHETLLSIYSQHYQVGEDDMSLAATLLPCFHCLQYRSSGKLGEGRGCEKRLKVFSISSKDAHKTDTQSSQKSRNNGGILPTVCAAAPSLLPSFAVA